MYSTVAFCEHLRGRLRVKMEMTPNDDEWEVPYSRYESNFGQI